MRWLGLLLATMLVAACATGGASGASVNASMPRRPRIGLIHETKDKFTSATTQYTENEGLDGGGLASARVSISFSRVFGQSGRTAFCTIGMTYQWHTWMFIERSRSLMLKAGDSTFTLQPLAAPSRDVVSGGVIEHAAYPVTLREIDRLVDARSVDLRLVGSKWNEDRSLSTKARERLDAFRSLVVSDSSHACLQVPPT
jgi:hypothetical protein